MNTITKLYEEVSNKTLLIMRGIPSSGKSTTIKQLVPNDQIFSADKFFERSGTYVFDRNLLGVAHNTCKSGVEKAMSDGKTPIAVDNTNTTVKEVVPYIDLAEKYGYKVVFVESKRPEWVKTSELLKNKEQNWTELEEMAEFFYLDNKKTHNVPKETILAMFKRWVPTDELEMLL